MNVPRGHMDGWKRLGVAQCARCGEAYQFEGDMEFGEYCRGCLDYIFEQAAMAPVSEMIQ